MAGADQSMISRFAKAAARQDELLSGGNIFDRDHKKKQLEAEQDFLLKRDRQMQENDLAKQTLSNRGSLDVANIQRTGQADIANINNTGQLTRQRLIEGTNYAKATNDYNADIFKTKADIFKTQAGFNVSSFNAATDRMNPKVGTRSPGDDEIIKGIWADQSMTADQKLAMTAKARASLSGGIQGTSGAPGQSSTDTRQTVRIGQPSVSSVNSDDGKDVNIPPAVSLFREETPNPVRQMIQNAQNVPNVPEKSLDEREAEFNKTSRSAMGFSIFNSPKEAAAMRTQQDAKNASAAMTAEQRRKKQEENKRKFNYQY